ncbi:MAG TPA: hypothetical protein PLS50_07260, partial [Candidatus Dojkabacteria bacterium]|nr:hypothetical protein [Candidatus Dojkabacteria bacterium]
TRPSLALRYIKEVVGDSVYKHILQEYIKRWEHKHPTPYDFFNTFNDVSKRNFNWFWRPWFFEHGSADISIKNIIVSGSDAITEIERVGILPVPINLKCAFEDGSSLTIEKSAAVWESDRLNRIIIKIPKSKKLKAVQLDVQLIPDIDLNNNNYTIIK